ncbi:MAG: LacI family DNA-binding transcriptional regulator, partial [Victivallaceae bacterium]|nr:LacI family DNA-binding transcriptional regulator [Victivallaceae bacterium]
NTGPIVINFFNFALRLFSITPIDKTDILQLPFSSYLQMIVAKKKRITIKDVARVSELSFATISRVLNGSSSFPEKTRKKVWDAANELNYTPNSRARKLRAGSGANARQKSGIIIHISHLGNDSPVGNEFESQRSLLLAWEAEKQGMFPISYWYYKCKGFQCPPVLNSHIDGAIVGTPHLEVVDILKDKIPIVLMDVPFSPQNANVPMVNLDYRHGFNELMTMLKENGHERIGTVHSTNTGDAVSTEIPVFNVLNGAAELAGIKLPEECCISRDINPDNHDTMMKEIATQFVGAIKEKKISAIILPNMSYAVSLYENLTEAGLKIPEDISIAMLYYGLKSPQYDITSVMYDWDSLIEASLNVLKNLINNKPLICREFLVPSKFFKGRTIGKLQQQNKRCDMSMEEK